MHSPEFQASVAIQIRGQGPLGVWCRGQRGSRLESAGVSH